MQGTDFSIECIERGADSARWRAYVPPDLAYLEGHFPGAPIVPGVAQIVALAEARARASWPDLGAPAGLRRVKFTAALRPRDSLTVTLERSGERVRFSIERGDEPCSRGTLLFSPPP
ncbi:MAG: hypothetical protein KC543_15460 [Myxococcales bacterium]|nr:hypothetical protein [Myxococcales bacterium]